MRIDRLDLIAWGSFTARSLDLSQGDSGLHLIYGDNEAGKSTSLRALIALLFGIPVGTSDNYLHQNPQLRIGGKLRLANGRSLDFVRRKGMKGTILSPGTEDVLDDAALLQFLPGGMDENLFTKLYGIDHGRLTAGGRELLDQSGDLGQALFSAALGAAKLRKILSELQSGAEELFKPRASTKIINRAISGFREANKRIRELSFPASEWKKLQQEIADAIFAIDETDGKIRAKGAGKSRLERINRVKGALAERRAVLLQIETLKEAQLLPEEFDSRRKSAADTSQRAMEAKTRAEARRQRLLEESDSLNIREELLNSEEEILAIYKELGAVEKTMQDRPQQDGKRRQLRNEAELLLKRVRPDIAMDDADRLRPLINNKKWISTLAHGQGMLIQRGRSAETVLRSAEEEQASIIQDIAGLPPSDPGMGELKAAVAVARKSGDLEQRLSDSRERAAEYVKACGVELSRLGRFSGTVENLMKIAMPVSETLDVFEKRLDELSGSLGDCDRRAKEIEAELKKAGQELKALLLAGDVPTISVLEELRAARDTGWNLIKGKYIEQKDVEDDIALFAGVSDLPVFYEQKIGAADHVSDQLRLAADQVAKRADLEARMDNLTARAYVLGEESRTSRETKENILSEWHNLWERLGIDAGTPREMKQWLIRVDGLFANARSADQAHGEVRKLTDERDDHREALSRQIAGFDDSPNLPGMSLEALTTICEQRIEQQKTGLERRRHLERLLNDAGNRIKKSREELAAIEKDHALWIKEWGRAVDGLGLPPDVAAERATETFDQLVAFFDRFDKSEELRKRIYGMDLVAETFKQRVFTFADGVGFERGTQSESTIAVRLNRELGEAREARASLKKIEKQKKEIQEEIEDADITIRTAREQLASLRQQAGVNTDEELEAAVEGSLKRRELQRKLAMLEQELTRNGDGRTIDELERESGALDIDSIDSELMNISSELEELQKQRDRHRDRKQTLQNERDAKDGSSLAAGASEEAQEQLAAMVSGIEQYLRLQIAALILEERIEDYRRKNQAPVLAMAGRLFSRLTMGSYANLRDELDDSGKPFLLGVRPDNKEIPVLKMSEGTRDQLYLSLRIATLEQHLQTTEPVPFVVDDILVGFDDNRTRVCLEILAEMAGLTQVLLFTHHRRVIEIAGSLHATAGIFLHELA